MSIDFSALTIRTDVPLPESARGPGGKKSNALADFLKSMAVGASVVVPVTIPENTKVGEVEAVTKEAKKKLLGTISGAARRIAKADATYLFATRSLADGVGVWRVAAETAAPATDGAEQSPEPVAPPKASKVAKAA